jgi:hypothetical protein
MEANLVPTIDGNYDLGATGIQFKDVHFSGSLYNNGKLFSGGGGTRNANNFLVAGGNPGVNGGALFSYSYDGMTWTASPTTGIFLQTACIAWNGTYWLAGGEKVGSGTDTVIAYSEDGITWGPLNTTVFDTACTCIAWNGRMWVAGAYSTDGTVLAYTDFLTNTWTPISIPGIYMVYSIATNGTIWVAGAEDDDGDGIGLYSYDGINWTTMIITNLGIATSIVWTGFVWVAAGTALNDSYSTSYSYDGIHWTNNEVNLPDSEATLSWNGSIIVYGANGGGGSSIFISTDGKMWYGVISSFIPRSITWNGSLWIGVGAGSGSSPVMAQSYDGFIWTAVETPQIGFGTVVTSRNVIGLNAFQYVPTLATGPVGPQTKLSAHIVPTADLTYDLGATGLRFRDIYVGGNSIYIGDSVVLKASGTNFSVTTPAGTNNLVSAIYVPNPAQVARNFTSGLYGGGGEEGGDGGGGTTEYIQGATAFGSIRSIATSADGSYISAIFVDTSEDLLRPSISVHTPSQAAGVFTVNKVLTTGTPRFNAIAMSTSGQRQIAVQQFTSPNGGGIYVSDDYGATWAEKWRSVPQAGQNFIAAAVTSIWWFAATATALFYTDQPAGAINSWSADTDYTTKTGPVNFTGITQIQASNDGKYLVILDATNLDAILYDLEDGSVGVYDLTGYTSPVISNVMEYGGFSVLAINSSSQPCIINFSNSPSVPGIEIVIPDSTVTTPKILISSQDSMFKLAVFNTPVANVTVTYYSYNYGATWTNISSDSTDLTDVTSILFSATANTTYLVRYQAGAVQQPLFTSTANSIYIQNSSLPYTPAVPSDWPVLPQTLTAAVDELATVAFSGGSASYPNGSYTDPVTNVTVTGPILSMGATGSAGPIILQAGLSPNHVMETYTTTGPNWSYSQVKAKPGSYSLNTVYGPSGPDLQNNLFTYVPKITFNTSRGYATGPTGLQEGDFMGIIEFGDNNTPLTSIFSGKLGPTGSTDAILFFNIGGLIGGTSIMAMSTTGPNNEGVPTGPVGPNIALGGHMYPTTDAAYNLGATGYQFKDVHFSGSLYNNGVPFQGGVPGLTYRATGPTGPTGGATGPRAPTLQIDTFLVPTVDATYDLGATGIQFKDVHFSGSLYNNGVLFSSGASYPSGSYTDPVTNVTVTGPILSMGATGSAGPIILQTGLSPNHVMESYTTTGPNWSYSQVKAKPGSYTLNTIYGPSGPDLEKNLLTYLPQIVFNTSRGYATGPTNLQTSDPLGSILFKDNDTLRSGIFVSKAKDSNNFPTVGITTDSFEVDTNVGKVVLASATYVPALPVASSFTPLGAATTANCIQPQGDPPYLGTFTLMATSADGQYITVVGPRDDGVTYSKTLIMVSSYATFTPNIMTRGNGTPYAVAVSELGQYQIVVENDPGKLDSAIFVSDDWGVTWSEVYIGDGGAAGAGEFTSCSVSETSLSGNPIFVVVGITNETSDQPSLLFCRDVPENKASWTKITTYPTGGGGGTTAFTSMTSVAISNDGTRLVVMDTGDTTIKRAIFYQIPASGPPIFNTFINVATIGANSDLVSHIISNITSTGFTLVAAKLTVDIYSFKVTWPTAASTPTINTTASSILGGLTTPTLPTKIVASSGVYQLVQCTDQSNNDTYTYLSSDSASTWTIIIQQFIAPFDAIATIAMSADASKTYCLAREATNSFKQALRTSLSVSSFIDTTPTTALAYLANGPVDENGGPTGPRAPTTQIGSHFLPKNDLMYDLGATGIRFRDIYVGGTSIYMGDSVVLKASATDFSVTTQAGTTSLASSTYEPPPEPAGAFTPLGDSTDENKIQPSQYAQYFSLMATSANGTYITVPGISDGNDRGLYYNGVIMVSSDSGVSFTATPIVSGSTPFSIGTGVAVSESGTYQIIVNKLSNEGEYGGGILVSSDSGLTWVETYLNGDGTANFLACAVSQSSGTSVPIFVAGADIMTDEVGPIVESGFIYCRDVPTNKGSWEEPVFTYPNGTSQPFTLITSVTISNDGTQLIIIDRAAVSTFAVFYEIGLSTLTHIRTLDISTITGDNGDIPDLADHVISNISSNAFTLVARDSEKIYSFQGVWLSGYIPSINGETGVEIRATNSSILPQQIIRSSDGVYQVVICYDTTAKITYTYISSSSGVAWTLIPQNAVSPFNTIATIAMSADTNKTYCICKEESLDYKQALRTSLRVGSYIQSSPTTALTYRARGNSQTTDPLTEVSSQFVPSSNATYDLGATGLQFRDVHFSGYLYNNGVPFSGGGGLTGLTYRATGPTGPTGGATGPAPDPTIQIGTHLVPTEDLAYDLGATGLRFRDIYVGGASIHMGDDVVLSASNGSLNATNNSGTVTLLSSGGGGGMLAGFGITGTQDGYFSTYYNSNTFSVPFPAEVTPIVLVSPLNLYNGSGVFTTATFTASNVTQSGFKVYSTASNARYSWMALPQTDITPTPPEIAGNFAITRSATSQLSLTVSFDRSNITGSPPLTYTLLLLEETSSTTYNVTDSPTINGTTYTYVVRNADGLDGGWPNSSLTPGNSYSFGLTVSNPSGSATSANLYGPFTTTPYLLGTSATANMTVTWSGAEINIAVTPESMNVTGNIGTLSFNIKDSGINNLFSGNQPMSFSNGSWRFTRDLSSSAAGTNGYIVITGTDTTAPPAQGILPPTNEVDIQLGTNKSFVVPSSPLNASGVSGTTEASFPAQTTRNVNLVGQATGGDGVYTYMVWYRVSNTGNYIENLNPLTSYQPVTLTGLTVNTTYQYYIKVTDAGGSTPANSSVQTFITPNWNPLSANDFTIEFAGNPSDPTKGIINGLGTPSGGNFQYRYQLFTRIPPASFAPFGSISDVSGWNLFNLTPESTYECYVRISDTALSTPINSPNYPTVQAYEFTTAADTPPITVNDMDPIYTPDATDPTSEGRVSWNGNPSGGSGTYLYELFYKPKEVSPPYLSYGSAQQDISGWNLNATGAGLMSGTTYQYYIVVTDDAGSAALFVPNINGGVAAKEFTTATPPIDASSIQFTTIAGTPAQSVVTIYSASGSSGITGGTPPYGYQLKMRRGSSGGFQPKGGIEPNLYWELDDLIGSSRYSFFVTVSDSSQSTPGDTSTFNFETALYPDLIAGSVYNLYSGTTGVVVYNYGGGSGGSGFLTDILEIAASAEGPWTDTGPPTGTIEGLVTGDTYFLRIKTEDNTTALSVESQPESITVF